MKLHLIKTVLAASTFLMSNTVVRSSLVSTSTENLNLLFIDVLLLTLLKQLSLPPSLALTPTESSKLPSLTMSARIVLPTPVAVSQPLGDLSTIGAHLR